MKVLGLMSGTSADGVDAVLAEFHGPVLRPRWTILASANHAYTPELRQRIIEAGQGSPLAAADWLELAEAITEAQARAARRCDPDGAAQLVGCHGQTVWHRPPADGRRGASWQVLQAPLLAQLLATPVIHDFRGADLALGGQGAPLVPATDAALLGRIGGWRALLNLGGIANVTLIPPARGPERNAPVRGWDCGPANTLIDLASQRLSGGARLFDAGGGWAAEGQVDESLVQRWLQEPYFQQQPPKSTGRELFGAADLERRLKDLQESRPGHSSADALASLTALSAGAVAQELRRGTLPLDLLVAGGGARNDTLMRELRRRCCGVRVRPLLELGIADDQREALAFALLAWWHHRRQPGSLPSVTGAERAALLGVRAEASR
ncbi:MAG: anhydro-N-acetylmuramic acid kinase [Synechococcus sp. ELA057]